MLAGTLGKYNPFRYRRYVYDVETGIFYVGSRYYDPVTGRFLNADDTDVMLEHLDDSILATNLYAYCLNNPVNFHDPDGEFAAAAGALTWGAAAGATNSWHPGGWVILGIVGVAAIGVGVYYLAKGGKQRIRDSGLTGLSNEEIARRLKDPRTSKSKKIAGGANNLTNDEKIEMLYNFEELEELGDNEFEKIKDLIADEDSFVRSRCANLLGYYEKPEALNLLFKLAKDEDDMVRTEAYDSMGEFQLYEVEQFLNNAIQTELDSLARRYAILSWKDVVFALYDEHKANIQFILELQTEEKSPDCLLCYSYGLYQFGKKQELGRILSFLKNSDYLVRCTTLSVLESIIDETNEKQIKNAIGILLIAENTVAVKSNAERFLKEH